MTTCRFIDGRGVFVLCLLVVGCSSTPRFTEREKRAREDNSQPKESARDRDAQPPKLPSGKILLTLEGIVSYYAHDFHGKLTSNGETFNMNDLTAAHRTFPFGTRVKVTNLDNKKSVVIRVNDRGPFIEGRIMDLSMGAAKEIDLIKLGTARARLEVIQWGDGK
jgi:rare lipoprotein A